MCYTNKYLLTEKQLNRGVKFRFTWLYLRQTKSTIWMWIMYFQQECDNDGEIKRILGQMKTEEIVMCGEGAMVVKAYRVI